MKIQSFTRHLTEESTGYAKLKDKKKLDEELEKALVDVLKAFFEELKNRGEIKKAAPVEDDYEKVLSANR